MQLKKKEFSMLLSSYAEFNEEKEKLGEDNKSIERITEKLKLDLKHFVDFRERLIMELNSVEDNNKKLNELKTKLKENEIKNFESELNELNFKLNEAVIKKKSFDEINKSINSLDICPLCKQKVSEDHKHTIIDEEKKKINQFLDNIPIIDIRINLINKEREKLKKERFRR